MQPLPENARRCPNCRTPRPTGRGVPIFFGLLSLVALIVLVFAMIKVVQHEDSQADGSVPSVQQQQPQKK